MTKIKKKTVSLVLGSGGARGMAHIGVIRWLLTHGYEIKSISGSSVGALVGGMYAAGKLDEFEAWAASITTLYKLKLFYINWNHEARGDKIMNVLIELFGDYKIEDLPITYTAVASDIRNEKEIWINKGSLFQALRASMAMPLFFTPVVRNGVDLIDGGVLNPVPIAPTFSDHTDLTIAVNLGGPIHHQQHKLAEKPHNGLGIPVNLDAITKHFSPSKKMQQEKGIDWKIYNIAELAIDAMQSTIARQKLAAYPADHIIEISRDACGTLEFERSAEMVKLGYQMADRCLQNV
ncbi:patatin-like protein of phospholipase family protein [Psychromonas ingrahamii 37]|uniref:Patatin-like protein of phospholipase family protein n=1 Tax=Psychromonas ingrahamii (strain DSM 17664 / CCUG 51855 / 37) TaxID=357804 RepID=A1SVV6_PSYIN|nr:patatin-like phospholipase family protein [Psychromonas ingrahamii]ABM03621.1 patatin-like protein of phospholipase family protein [Psychromonas ingrahamii 37]